MTDKRAPYGVLVGGGIYVGFRGSKNIYEALKDELGLTALNTPELVAKTIFTGYAGAGKQLGKIYVTYKKEVPGYEAIQSGYLFCARAKMSEAVNTLPGQKFRTYIIQSADYPRDRRYI